MQILEPEIRTIVSQQVRIKTKEEKKEEDTHDIIKNLIMEFAGESEGLVEQEVLTQSQKILTRLLSKIL